MLIPHARRMNLIALALLVTALIAFTAFHLLPVDSGIGSDDGWRVWQEIGLFLETPNLEDLQTMIGISSFLTCVVMILTGPFLIPVLRRSRLAWWLATIVSGMAFAGLGVVVAIHNLGPGTQPGPAVFCLLAALALNFLGLLFIRREVPAAPAFDS
jgi:hypothetical protein